MYRLKFKLMSFVLLLLTISLIGCQKSIENPILNKNKELATEFFADIDNNNGTLDFIDKWMMKEFKSHFNNPKPMDLDGYRQFMLDAINGFSTMRHEIQYLVAEGDLVCVGITLHLLHSGEFAGMNPTGRQIAVEEIVTLKIKNSKIIEEWGVFDFAGLQAKLTVADEKLEN